MSTYSLEEIKTLIKSEGYFITSNALKTALQDFDFSETEIIRGVLSLQPTHFYKTMPSDKKPGLFQDVYKMPVVKGKQVANAYIKLQINMTQDGDLAVVISFKEA